MYRRESYFRRRVVWIYELSTQDLYKYTKCYMKKLLIWLNKKHVQVL